MAVAAAAESLSADELEAKLSSWAGSVAASEYRWLRLAAEYDRRKLYERLGMPVLRPLADVALRAQPTRRDGEGPCCARPENAAAHLPAEGDAIIDGAGPIDNDTLRRLCCDASLITLVENDDGQPVAGSAKTRTIPAARRRAVRARDKCCRFPGCPNTSCHIDLPYVTAVVPHLDTTDNETGT